MKVNGVARPIVILMAEDDDDDALLAEEAMKDDKISNELHRVKDGVEALDFLSNRPPYQNVPRPDLILLDLNMPRMDGRQFLAQMKHDARYHDVAHIPVVVFTSSDSEADASEAWSLGAATYVVKPISLMEFRRVVRKLSEYWVQIVRYEGRPGT